MGTATTAGGLGARRAHKDGCAQRGRGRNRAASAARLLGTLLLVAVIVTFLPLAGPRLFGLDVYAITSGSMEPQIPVGSAVYTQAQDPATLADGDVVAFARTSQDVESGAGATVVHRVVANRVVEGELVTKGDANDAPDPTAVPYGTVAGRVVAQVPYLGALALVYGSGVGKIAALACAGAGLLLHLAAGALERR